MKLRSTLEEYTEAEFEELVSIVFYDRLDSDEELSDLIDEIDRLTEHPRKYGIICYPEPDAEDSPKGVINTIKTWRAANGKPGFKPV
ncbi:bacteriocin immunity protein [Pseudomonas sp. R5(2019)]|uniref:bacteriocin immunity protein n=1 Tax=Pseudomonas sp. R5(2019) TaxID=2697566 RepID=UPI001411F42F|nr:bacteriocin immunity protein [Pseudomonas sp. R5(2019)]NBA93415.1 bacteriocin immunity protein [Pseudomonas sp. R5(2019)]